MVRATFAPSRSTCSLGASGGSPGRPAGRSSETQSARRGASRHARYRPSGLELSTRATVAAIGSFSRARSPCLVGMVGSFAHDVPLARPCLDRAACPLQFGPRRARGAQVVQRLRPPPSRRTTSPRLAGKLGPALEYRRIRKRLITWSVRTHALDRRGGIAEATSQSGGSVNGVRVDRARTVETSAPCTLYSMLRVKGAGGRTGGALREYRCALTPRVRRGRLKQVQAGVGSAAQDGQQARAMATSMGAPRRRGMPALPPPITRPRVRPPPDRSS